MLKAVAAAVAGSASGPVAGPTPAASTDNAIARWDGTSGRLLQNTSGATISDNFALTLAGATVTASEPILNLTQTWNNVAVTFAGARLNVTDTTSATASLLLDLQVGGTSRLSIRKDGAVLGPDGSVSAPTYSFGSQTALGMYRRASGIIAFSTGADRLVIYSQGIVARSDGALQWSSSADPAGTPDLGIWRDAANTFAQRNGTAAQTHRVYRTYTDASNYERVSLQSGAGYFEVASETAGTGTDDLDLRLTPSSTTAAVDFRNPANGAAAQLGTLTNAPSAGNPAYWLKIKIAGTIHYIPAWT
jgi:hypothetical protein